MRLRTSLKESERSRPRDQTADPVPYGSRRLGPIDKAILFFDFASIAGAFRSLGLRWDFSRHIFWCGSDKQLGSHPAQARVERCRIVGVVNDRSFLCEDLAGIQASIHFHNGDPRFGFVVEKCPLDGGCTTVFWKQ